jgi:energy-coupling factor transporter ATP-binding protein EcfA2
MSKDLVCDSRSLSAHRRPVTAATEASSAAAAAAAVETEFIYTDIQEEHTSASEQTIPTIKYTISHIKLPDKIPDPENFHDDHTKTMRERQKSSKLQAYAEYMLQNYKQILGLDWQNIPGLAIITGINGSGKTTLLDYIHELLIKDSRLSQLSDSAAEYSDEEILYINSELNIFERFHTKSAQVEYGYKNRLEIAIENVKNKLKGDEVDSTSLDSARHDGGVSDTIIKIIEAEKLDKHSIDDDKIEELAAKAIPYSQNKLILENPLDLLKYLSQSYLKQLNAVEKKFKNDINSLNQKTLIFYLTNEFNLITDKIDKIIENTLEKANFIHKTAKARVGQSPIDEVNYFLNKYGFKFRIKPGYEYKGVDEGNVDKISIKCITLEEFELYKDIDILGFTEGVFGKDLSSGEKLLLRIFCIQYYVRGLSTGEEGSYSKVDNKIKLMLLDEVDAHFHPTMLKTFVQIIKEEFVSKGIQVIMTTHNRDTVKLASVCNPSDPTITDNVGIYTIETTEPPEKKLFLEKTHPLTAMFRLSKGVEELHLNTHRVYTESLTDSWFYKGVYTSLKSLSDQAREDEIISKSTSYKWEIDKHHSERALSKRYTMDFYPVSAHKGERDKKSEGGCGIVKMSVLRDRNAHQILDLDGSKIEDLLVASYGILDNDGDKEYKLADNSLEKRCVITGGRYSIENFIFDPVVFCSVLSNEEITTVISNAANFWKETYDIKEDKYKITKIYTDLKKLLNECDFSEHTQELVDQYFSILLQKMSKGYSTKKQKPSSYDLLKTDPDGLTKVPVTIMVKSDDNKLNTFTLKYPEVFLKIRGHDIENNFFGRFKKCDGITRVSDLISEKVSRETLKFIPFDLAKIFFNLNQWIRDDLRSVIKPEKRDPASLVVGETEQKEDEGESGSQLTEPVVILQSITGGLEDSDEEIPTNPDALAVIGESA